MAEVKGNMRGSIQGSLWALILGATGLGFASIVAGPDADTSLEAAGTPKEVGSATLTAAVPTEAETPRPDEVPPTVAADPSPPPALPSAVDQDGASVVAVRPTNNARPVAVAQPDGELEPPSSDTEEIDTASFVLPRAPAPATLQEAVTPPMPPQGTSQADLSATSDASVAPIAPGPVAAASLDATLDPSATEGAPTPDAVVGNLDQPTDDNRPLIENSASEFTPFIVNVDPTAPVVEEETPPASPEVAIATPTQPEPPQADSVISSAGVTDNGAAGAARLDQALGSEATEEEDAPIVASTDAAGSTTAEPENAEPVQEETVAASGGPVRVNRPSETPSVPAGQDATVVTDAPQEEALPALEAFAAEFEYEGEVPLIAVMLVDQPDQPELSAALGDLGFAPSVAVNALDANAGGRMTAYRDSGAEVAMQVALPDGARPTDVEVAFEAAFEILPEAAMLFSDGTGVLQNSRSVTTQVMDVLAAEGRGFVTVQRGLDSSVRLAADAGVTAAPVSRVLDDGGADARAVTRALDQAAFRARQDGGAIVVAELTAENVETLSAWLAELDLETLRPAPVSALLLAQNAEE